MNNIIERQTFVFSVDLAGLVLLNTSEIQSKINLRFAADELILKSIAYNSPTGADIDDVVQIWCNLTHDGLITSFPNNAAYMCYCDVHFRLNNTFQTGNAIFQFQQTGAPTIPYYYTPQPGIVQGSPAASNSNGIVSFTIEFVKLSK